MTRPIEGYDTARLVLRRPTMADLDEFFAIDGDPLTHLHNPAGPHTTIELSAMRLQSYIQDWDASGIGYWIIELKPDGGTIGITGLRPVEVLGREVLNLYYRFRPSARGMGYATEAARTAMDVAQGLRPFPRQRGKY